MEKINDYIHDWQGDISYPKSKVQDETLRDGLQAPYVTHPTLEQKQTLLHIMDQLGIDGADIGFPASGDRHLTDVIGMAQYKQQNRLSIKLSCAGRTTEEDVYPIIKASEVSGEPIEADLFIGSSEIRKIVQDWDLEDMQLKVQRSVGLAVAHGLPVMFVTEDTTRAQPDTLLALYDVAIESGAERICVADTVGFATPTNTRNLLEFIKTHVVRGRDIKIDWHGHRDLGLSMANSLEAALVGVDRIHGTALGVGERSGNTRMEELLVNFSRQGIKNNDLSYLPEYSQFASKILQLPIPVNEPITGEQAFNTASGVHAAAILKARQKDRQDLAGVVYSAFDPRIIGREEDVRIGPLSGKANVELALQSLGIEPDGNLVATILQAAKNGNQLFSKEEIRTMANRIRRD